MIKTNTIYNECCLDTMLRMADNTVDLIITSPPYADRRLKQYGGCSHDEYVKWFTPIAQQILRVLKPTGTFILNIKENVVKGERSTYVLELIIEMRKHGWFWTEEFIWHKRNSYPGKWPNRFRDSWERLLQFNKAKKFNMYQDAVLVPIGEWAKPRLANLSDSDTVRKERNTGSGFGVNMSNWVDKDMVLPTNVLHLATECGNKKHSAAFPIEIPEWFIKCFTREGDVVYDPFAGSGTTAVAAHDNNRVWIGSDVSQDHVFVAYNRLLESGFNIFQQ